MYHFSSEFDDFPPEWSLGLHQCRSTGNSWWCSWTDSPAPWPACLFKRWWSWSWGASLPKLMLMLIIINGQKPGGNGVCRGGWLSLQPDLSEKRPSLPRKHGRTCSTYLPGLLFIFRCLHIFTQYLCPVASSGHTQYFHRTHRALMFSKSNFCC